MVKLTDLQQGAASSMWCAQQGWMWTAISPERVVCRTIPAAMAAPVGPSSAASLSVVAAWVASAASPPSLRRFTLQGGWGSTV